MNAKNEHLRWALPLAAVTFSVACSGLIAELPNEQTMPEHPAKTSQPLATGVFQLRTYGGQGSSPTCLTTTGAAPTGNQTCSGGASQNLNYICTGTHNVFLVQDASTGKCYQTFGTTPPTFREVACNTSDTTQQTQFDANETGGLQNIATGLIWYVNNSTGQFQLELANNCGTNCLVQPTNAWLVIRGNGSQHAWQAGGSPDGYPNIVTVQPTYEGGGSQQWIFQIGSNNQAYLIGYDQDIPGYACVDSSVGPILNGLRTLAFDSPCTLSAYEEIALAYTGAGGISSNFFDKGDNLRTVQGEDPEGNLVEQLTSTPLTFNHVEFAACE